MREIEETPKQKRLSKTPSARTLHLPDLVPQKPLKERKTKEPCVLSMRLKPLRLSLFYGKTCLKSILNSNLSSLPFGWTIRT